MVYHAPGTLGLDDYNLNELTTFAEVMRRGSLAAAAKSLGVPKSTVGRRIGRLEERLDVLLFTRDGRQASATKEARALFDRTSSAIESLNAALRATHEGYKEPAGVIRITGPTDVGRLCMAKAVAAFAQAHPRIRFDVNLTDRMVDLVQEGVDVALRAGPFPEEAAAQSLISRKVGEVWVCVAGGQALAGQIRTIKALEKAPWILFRESGPQARVRLVRHGRERFIEVRARHTVTSFSAMAALIREGEGVGILPEIHVDYGRDGLERILPDYRWHWADLNLAYPSRSLATRVSLFIDHISTAMAELIPT